MNAISSPLDTQSFKFVGDPAIVKKIKKDNTKVLSLSTNRNQMVVVVKVEYKIRSGLLLSYKCSYQSQTGAKPNW